jgi:rhodanese-related sulfurtransferase
MEVTFDRLVEFISNHWIMSSGLFIVIILLIQDLFESVTRKHKTLSPTEAIVLMNDERSVVIDVREPNEFAEGHIEGARNIPVSKVAERAHELEAHKQSPVIVTCNSGARSPEACKKLVSQGFGQIFELKGGMMAWEDQKLPVSKKRGK